MAGLMSTDLTFVQMAGIEDCYTSAKGSTGTLGNFGELQVFNLSFHVSIPDDQISEHWTMIILDYHH